MSRTLCLTILAAAVAMPTFTSAQDIFRNQSFRLPVVALGPDTFEVIEADGAGGTQFWCAAGLYTRLVLGQRGGDITVVTARGPAQSQPGRKGVVFTTDPAAIGASPLSRTVRRAGVSFSMGHAYALCSDLPGVSIETQDGRRISR